MSDLDRPRQMTSSHPEHYCDHEDAVGVRCRAWGSYGFEESSAITLWYCKNHQPQVYRGLKAHGQTKQ